MVVATLSRSGASSAGFFISSGASALRVVVISYLPLIRLLQFCSNMSLLRSLFHSLRSLPATRIKVVAEQFQVAGVKTFGYPLL
ncbi:unnamed protein product [Arabis nemorensis]|uniref:Uncharacterized protein n=1 Tax=Arabis nemorensis TaxID=586526 RepID=A0A565BBW4_9BRAS|nr:unnamed protein product [Arabis nemorensis]